MGHLVVPNALVCACGVEVKVFCLLLEFSSMREKYLYPFSTVNSALRSKQKSVALSIDVNPSPLKCTLQTFSDICVSLNPPVNPSFW